MYTTQMLERSSLEARIRYRSHRGMLELDLMFVPFAKHLPELTLEELILLDEMLNEQDPDLHAWLMLQTIPDLRYRKLIDKIRQVA